MLSSNHKFEKGQLLNWGSRCMIVDVFDTNCEIDKRLSHFWEYSGTCECLKLLFMPRNDGGIVDHYPSAYVRSLPNVRILSEN